MIKSFPFSRFRRVLYPYKKYTFCAIKRNTAQNRHVERRSKSMDPFRQKGKRHKTDVLQAVWLFLNVRTIAVSATLPVQFHASPRWIFPAFRHPGRGKPCRISPALCPLWYTHTRACHIYTRMRYIHIYAIRATHLMTRTACRHIHIYTGTKAHACVLILCARKRTRANHADELTRWRIRSKMDLVPRARKGPVRQCIRQADTLKNQITDALPRAKRSRWDPDV